MVTQFLGVKVNLTCTFLIGENIRSKFTRLGSLFRIYIRITENVYEYFKYTFLQQCQLWSDMHTIISIFKRKKLYYGTIMFQMKCMSIQTTYLNFFFRKVFKVIFKCKNIIKILLFKN